MDANNATSRRPAISYPIPSIGSNSDVAAVIASCPSREYHRCFAEQIRNRYPVTQFKKRHRPFRCYGSEAATKLSECRALVPDEVPIMDRKSQFQLKLCEAEIPPPPPPTSEKLRCDSDHALVQARTTLLIGVPSSPNAKGRKRRDAIRAAWMQDPLVGSAVVVCFLLSAETPPPALEELRSEHTSHGDVLLVDAPETGWIIRTPTRYSNGTKRGRGMPTFKQHRFFQIAAARWPAVPYVAKFDDDTAPNLRLLVPLLRRLRCAAKPLLFIGAINWAGVVPRAEPEGVRADRCGFAWDMIGALSNFGKQWGTPGISRGPGKYMEACDRRGSVLPVPYAAGAGYIFSAALLQWVATSAAVSNWVADARGTSREDLQWQKFEDTSTGYWLSYAPRTVHYIDVAPLVHDIDCHPEGTRLRDGDGTYRPPSNTSLLVHNLKTPSAFAYAHEHMRGDAVAYDQNRCNHGVHDAPLLDESIVRAREQQRSTNLWARAARDEMSRLSTQHNVHLRTALSEAGLACPKCRKKVMAELMRTEAVKLCTAAAAAACLARVRRNGTAVASR